MKIYMAGIPGGDDVGEKNILSKGIRAMRLLSFYHIKERIAVNRIFKLLTGGNRRWKE